MNPERPSWSEVRSWFPALERWTYLNAASMSPVPRRVHAAMAAFLDRCRDNDVSLEVDLFHAEPLRARAASWLRCSPAELCFVPSTSAGALRAAACPAWREGDNVVVPAGSFPALLQPLLGLRERGVEIRLVEAGSGENPVGGRRGGPAEHPGEEEILAAVDGRTRLVCVSWVSFVTGRRLDLVRLGEACRRRGVLLYADLIQGAGALRPDLGAWPVDMAAFQPVKWIPAPNGLGLFYCREDLVEEARIPFHGWTSVRREGLDDLTDLGLPLWDDARRFEVGSVPPLLVAGFDAALQMLEELGAAAIRERVLDLGRRVREGLLERGFEVVTPPSERARAGITTFRCAQNGPVVARLREENVVVAAREGLVRVSTHFYNDEEDVDRLLEALPSRGASPGR